MIAVRALGRPPQYTRIKKASVIGTQTQVSVEGKNVTLYRIEVVPTKSNATKQPSGEEQTGRRHVAKRFSEFVELREALTTIDKKGLLKGAPEFPSKDILGTAGKIVGEQLSFFTGSTQPDQTDVVEERMTKLNAWLAAVVPHGCFSTPLQTFLADEDMRELRSLQGLDRLAESSMEAQKYADAAEAYSQALAKQAGDPQANAKRLCGRARCYKELALAQAATNAAAGVQLWNKVLEDAVAATQSLPLEQTKDADSLRLQAQRELAALSQTIMKEARQNHGSCEGPVHCQFAGKGEFEEVWLSLSPSGTFAGGRLEFKPPPERMSGGNLPPQRTAELRADIIVSKPKTERKGHDTALRLDLGSVADDRGCKKYIIAVKSDEDLARWKSALSSYGVTQAKVVRQSENKQLHSEIDALKSFSTEVKRKTTSPYWDETCTL